MVDEFSSKLQDFNTKLKNISDGGGGVLGSMNNAASGVQGFINTIQSMPLVQVGQQLLDIAGGLNEVGVKINKLESTFLALSGSSANATMNLEAMRTATRGVVDDLTLIEGANKLLGMGIAGSTEELAKFTELAVTLGASAGKDAATALNDFGLMLSNTSVLRLDTFNLSSAAVKQTMKELQAETEGLDRQTAFLQATLIEGEKAMARLGDSVEENATSAQKLATRFENAKNELAEFVADGVEGIAKLLDGFIKLGDQIGTIFEQAKDNPVANFFESMPVLSGLSFAGNAGSIEAGVAEATKSWDALNASITNTFQAAITYAESNPIAEENAAIQGYVESMEAINDILRERRQLNEGNMIANDPRRIQEMNVLGERTVELIEQEIEARREQQRIMRELNEGNLMASGDNLLQRFGLDEFGEFQRLAKEVQNIFGEKQTKGGSEMNVFDKADSLDSYLAELDAAYAEMEAMHAKGMISDEQLAAAQTMRNDVATMATDARSMADAINNMNLSQLLGEGSGGVMGEMSDDVIAAMEARGATPEQIEAARGQFDLASGRESEFSQFYETEVPTLLARIAEEVSPEASILAMERIENAIKEGRAIGADDATLMGMVQNAAGYQIQGVGTGTQFSVQSGDTVSGLMSSTGLTQEQIMSAANITNPRYLQPGTYGAAGGEGALVGTGSFLQTPGVAPIGAYGSFGMNTPFNSLGRSSSADTTQGGAEGEDPLLAMQQNIDNINTSLDLTATKFSTGLTEAISAPKTELETLTSELDALASKQVAVMIKITADMSPEIKALLGGNVNIGSDIRNNGGIVPGADNRVNDTGGNKVF